MRVINHGNKELALYWIDYSGAAMHMHCTCVNILAGETRGVVTYGAHPWLIANPRDKIVGTFILYTAARDTDIII